LCRTTPSSWGETSSKTGKITFNEGLDKKGPLSMCVFLAEKRPDAGILVVIGNSSFVSNQYVNYSSNSDLFMNIVSFLVKDEDLISIRPKNDAVGKFEMQGGLLVGIVLVYVIPFIILISGIIFWYRRRRNRE